MRGTRRALLGPQRDDEGSGGANPLDTRLCGACGHERRDADFRWTVDRYGIPWRKVCPGCWQSVQEQINEWRFNPNDAGERLEGDE